MTATAAATLVAWAAVNQVTDQVSPPVVLPLPSVAVVADARTSPAAPAASDAPRAHKRDRDDREGRDNQATGQDGDAGTPATQASPIPPSPQPDLETTTPPEPDPSREGEQEHEGDDDPADEKQAVSRTEGYELVGGTVTVTYRNGATNLVQATPNSGFVVELNDSGPDKVDVRFRSDNHESRLVTRWDDGAPDPDKEERSR